MRVLLLPMLVLLASCKTVEPAPTERVVYHEVRVPVAVARTPTDVTLGCLAEAPKAPEFIDLTVGDIRYVALSVTKLDQLYAFEIGAKTCDSAWRAWATSP